MVVRNGDQFVKFFLLTFALSVFPMKVTISFTRQSFVNTQILSGFSTVKVFCLTVNSERLSVCRCVYLYAVHTLYIASGDKDCDSTEMI